MTLSMFDELHDPHPPTATSRHLASVAERAASMRRRRAAATGGVAAVALVAAGTLAVLVTDPRGSTDEVAGDALPAAAQPSGDTATTSTPDASTTDASVTDPSDLPPAVPVIPDPSELPPAVPVNPDPDDGAGDGDAAAGSETGGSGDTSTGDTSTEASPGDPADTSESAGTLDAVTAAAMRGDDPIVAITASGAAVWFPSPDDEPVEVAGAGVVRLDFLVDGAATLGRAGTGNLEVIAADGEPERTLAIGSDHEVSPDGTTVCGVDRTSPVVRCHDIEADEPTSIELDRSEISPTDLTWFDASTVLVIGGLGDGWTISIVDIDAGVSTTRGFAGRGAFADLRFAGRDALGRLAVHDAGTDQVLLGELDRYGGWDPDGDGTLGSALEVRELDAAHRSVWLDGGVELLVSADGILAVDGIELAGTYSSART